MFVVRKGRASAMGEGQKKPESIKRPYIDSKFLPEENKKAEIVYFS